jgi:predicted nucleic acid-binding protein
VELGRDNPTSRRLKALLADKSIKRAAPRSAKIKLYGDGERAAINLALERKFLLLIDDWRPYEAAQAAGIEVNSLAYLVGLCEQKRITLERALEVK